MSIVHRVLDRCYGQDSSTAQKTSLSTNLQWKNSQTVNNKTVSETDQRGLMLDGTVPGNQQDGSLWKAEFNPTRDGIASTEATGDLGDLGVQPGASSPEKVHIPDKNCGSQKKVLILRSHASKSECSAGSDGFACSSNGRSAVWQFFGYLPFVWEIIYNMERMILLLRLPAFGSFTNLFIVQ
jgi:hypothetical protein